MSTYQYDKSAFEKGYRDATHGRDQSHLYCGENSLAYSRGRQAAKATHIGEKVDARAA